MKSIEEQLILHEGLKLKPYRCTAGKLTIGVGRNLEDKGLTEDEALFLLANDIREISKQLEQYGWYRGLDAIRQKVIVDMAFNLGVYGLLSFKDTIQALNCYDYDMAAKEMENSRWYRQVGERGRRLVEMMRTGEDYDE